MKDSKRHANDNSGSHQAKNQAIAYEDQSNRAVYPRQPVDTSAKNACPKAQKYPPPKRKSGAAVNQNAMPPIKGTINHRGFAPPA